MGMAVRILNEQGIRGFREYLADLRAGSRRDPPDEILTDPWCSAKVQGSVGVEQHVFDSRLDAAKYLIEALRPLGRSTVEQNIGLWSWLSLFYFDQVCPVIRNGKRIPGQDYRHILDTDSRRYYRHLLVGPYTVFQLHGEGVPVLLCNPLPRPSKFYEELSSRQGFVTNKGVMEAANLLYYDARQRKAKRGSAVTSRMPGTLFRFIDVVQQLDLTYDLYSMTGQEVLDLLPSEFDEWKRT